MGFVSVADCIIAEDVFQGTLESYSVIISETLGDFHVAQIQS